MNFLSAILGGLVLGLFMAISVGPTLFAVLRYSLNHSYRAGIAFVLGVSVSDAIYVTIASVASPWLQFLHSYERPMYYGFGTLLVLAGLVGILRKTKPQQPSVKLVSVSNAQYAKIFGSGFLINTLNPALIIQWIAAATGLAHERNIYRIAFFTSCLILVLGIDILKVVLADKIRTRLTVKRLMYLQRISAGVIFLFGIAILIVTAVNKG
jgi:threonine/homoserine/homoserine lactone efflux protein